MIKRLSYEHFDFEKLYEKVNELIDVVNELGETVITEEYLQDLASSLRALKRRGIIMGIEFSG